MTTGQKRDVKIQGKKQLKSKIHFSRQKSRVTRLSIVMNNYSNNGGAETTYDLSITYVVDNFIAMDPGPLFLVS